MELTLDLDGRHVLVVGSPDPVRRLVAALTASAAVVRVVAPTAALAAVDSGPGTDGAVPDLVVWAADPADRALRAAVAERCRTLRVPLADDEPLAPTPLGHVTLVGGGPGTPDLLTTAGRRALAQADVVLHDRLGPGEHLDALAPGAEFVDVGKTPGHHAVPQHEIERRIVEHARRGRRVVRLKGGDPFVFGRGGEEVIACRAAGVPVTVVPGISSAIAVPAEAGIPVTHREVSKSFTVVSGHLPFSEDEFAHFVGLGGTIVLLMGVGNVHHTVAGLRRHGMADTMPVAVLEQGFSDRRRSLVTTLAETDQVVAVEGVRSPAVIVIGEVVRVAGWGLLDHLQAAGVPGVAEVVA